MLDADKLADYVVRGKALRIDARDLANLRYAVLQLNMQTTTDGMNTNRRMVAGTLNTLCDNAEVLYPEQGKDF